MDDDELIWLCIVCLLFFFFMLFHKLIRLICFPNGRIEEEYELARVIEHGRTTVPAGYYNFPHPIENWEIEDEYDE